MGFVADVVGGLFGSGADAAEDAADAQVQSADAAIAEQRAAREQAREDLTPFRGVGERQIRPVERGVDRLGREAGAIMRRSNDLGRQAGGIERSANRVQSLATNPNQQRNFIENNPFFDALADDAQDRLFSNAAAKGKVGSGGTAEALQNSIMLLGADLLNQNINQRLGAFNAQQGGFNARTTAFNAKGQGFDALNAVQSNRTNLLNIGQASAAGQANAALSTGQNIADLNTQAGNAAASGIIGARNAQTGALNNVINTGITAFALSDRRAKTDIKKVGKTDGGLPVYIYRYKGGDIVQMGVMAQEAKKQNPKAVKTINDLMHVDYREIA